MRVLGVWIGWGLGDESSKDFTVKDFRAFARAKFKSYAGHLADNNKFDQELEDVVREMQRRYVEDGKLLPGTFVPGVLDLATQQVCGFKKRVIVLPTIITVEGHMSNMFVGPCAYVASTLEGQGVCWWQATGYENTTLPFHSNTGVNEVLRFMMLDVLPNGRPFPLGTPWGFVVFSEGSIVGRRVYRILKAAFDKPAAQRNPTEQRYAVRFADLTRAIAFGDACREKDVIAEWVPDPPKRGTQGISDENMVDTPSWWKPHSRHGDLYSENQDDEVGQNKTAIFRIAVNNSWGGLFKRFGDLLRDPVDGTFDIAKAIIEGAMFLPNMGPHGTYDLNPCVEYMRGVGIRRAA